jgi:putative oxidoreductase
MKIAALIARYLLGLIFLIFGLNGFLHFIPNQPMPAGPAGQFLSAMVDSHYLLPVCAVEVIGAILLLINRYVPLGLTLLAPVIFNILLFHIFMAPAGIAPGIVVTILWFLVASRVRFAFAGILQSRTAS